MKKILLSLMITLSSILLCTASWAASYYVDISKGNDDNPGTISQPWKTISKANNTLRAGDTVFLKNGTYKETIRPVRSGEEGRYITYARNENDEVIITGVSDGANLEDRNYIVIDGIRIENVGKFSIYPNPVTDYFRISDASRPELIEIFSIVGVKILEFKSVISNIYSVKNLQKGQYIVKITFLSGQTAVSRLIK